MKQTDESKASLAPHASNPDQPIGQEVDALQQARKQVEFLQLELAKAQQELSQMKALAGSSHIGLTASSDTIESPVQSPRVLSLELLGKQVLEKAATPGSTLEEIVAFCLAGVEKLHKGMYCSCLRLQGAKLYNIASPSLPEGIFSNDGIPIGQQAGSCGTAAFLGQKVIASDITTDPRWQAHYPYVLAYGFKASWSFPLVGSNQKVLGTVAAYYKEVKSPTPEEEESLESIRNLLQLILENKLTECELRQSNERYYYATVATKDAIWDLDIINYRIEWGVGFEKLFGFKVKEFGPEVDIWAAHVHPDDLERVEASLWNVINSKDLEHWRDEYRFRKADGVYTYVEDQGTLLRDEMGRPVRMVGALQDVTEQKLIEEELRKLSLVARETINAVIIMKPDSTIQWINPAFTRIFGYTLEEIEGRKPIDFLVGPETDSETLQYLRKEFEDLEPLELEIVQYTKAREKLWCKLQIQALLTPQGQVESIFALLTDVTQRKAEEEQLRLMESVITNSKDGIIISKVVSTDPQRLEAIFVNQAFTQMTGYTPEEALGKDPAFLNCPETDVKTIQEVQQCMQTGQPSESELESCRMDGSRFWTQLLLIPMFDSRQQLTHWISLLRDITNRRKYMQEREVLISELTQNNADLKQFTFITSHNLRAPLANLTGIANLIDTEAIPEGRNRILIEKFKESTVQLNTIIDDLLEVLVIKDNPHTNKEQVNLQEAFEKVVMSVDGLMTDVDVHLTTDFSQVQTVYYNAGYLHSILLNLLTNAIKYRSPDRDLHIDVKAENVNGKQTLYFSDNGLGIDLNRFGERIFGLYQRFHYHKDSKGMGLYIAHSQAKAMGGNLSVQSEVDKGATFILEF
ncbi:PAS domain S-box protein [Rufibacter tibetensis]|uniref:PAS domain S-box protein n=1 Tax=Rufibacter tibetensis TaxID=512763 RepID=UPI000786612B|nr:PAS domain S-box protein [Rufibacter tibetensis]